MDAFVIEKPVAGVVCEQLCVLAADNRRAVQRPPDGWVEHGKKLERSYHGHKLLLEPLMIDGRVNGWFKWLDQHYRGIESDKLQAEHLLELEAEAFSSAWSKREAWVANGSPERRRGR